MRVELARLRNEIELQRNDMDNLRRRQRELYDDLDYRLRARERGAAPVSGDGRYPSPIRTPPGEDIGAASPGTDAPASTADTPDSAEGGQAAVAPGAASGQGATEVVVEPWRTRTPEAATPPGDAGMQRAPTTAPTMIDVGEQQLYDEAFEKLKQSRYPEAIQGFRELLARFPNGALADDAHYWIAEAQYVTREFQSALAGFRTVSARYPDSPRAPEALLKVGYIQLEVGAREQARVTLNEVIARYPGSRVAVSAQTRLQRLEQGGN